MAEATFTLKAVDATKAAFAAVQNSLGKLEKSTQGLSKITKLAFGGEAMLGALNMMKQRLDKVALAGEEAGFSDEQIVAAMKMENLIEGTLNLFMKLPLALAQVGISISNAFSPITSGEIEAQLKKLRGEQFKKELEASSKVLGQLKNDFDQIGMSQEQLTAAKKNLAETLGRELDKAREGTDLRAVAAKEIEVQKVLNDLKKDDTAETQKLNELQKQSGALRGARMLNDLKEMQSRLAADKDRLSQLTGGGKEAQPFALNMQAEEKSTAQKIKDQEEMIRLIPQIAAEEEKVNAILFEQNRLFRDAGAMIAQGFEDAILSGQKLSEVIRGLGQDLLRLVFSNMITQPLAKGIGTFLSGMRAEGGPVNAGGAYVVGEKGPELFVPRSSGSIVPNGAMGSSGRSAGGVTVNYNIAAGVSRAELVPILEQERRRLKAEIPDMVRRGGSYRSAFA